MSRTDLFDQPYSLLVFLPTTTCYTKNNHTTGLAAVKRLSELPEAWTSAARVNASAFLYQKVGVFVLWETKEQVDVCRAAWLWVCSIAQVVTDLSTVCAALT